MISYIIPTRNRPEQLAQTLEAISRMGDHRIVGGAEVIVVDNASEPAAWTPQWLRSGVPVRLLRRELNEGAAARNAAARAASEESTWLVMLDDDSQPVDVEGLESLQNVPGDVGAIGAEIFLPDMSHESGGLPEVFIGCGVAIRREVFLRLGGYDATFDYYAEEYDLAARMMGAGFRIGFDRRFRVLHRKVSSGRDFGRIIERLVRNNGWVAQRYAPEEHRRAELREVVTRYGRIAWKERAMTGYAKGAWELARTLRRQARSPLRVELWDRLTGLHHARVALAAADAAEPLGRVMLVSRGKNAWAVERALEELGITIVTNASAARTLVIGTMSPGPMLDAISHREEDDWRVVAPWVEATRGTALATGTASLRRESGRTAGVGAAEADSRNRRKISPSAA
jgi:GT2 family glycosyltransferase